MSPDVEGIERATLEAVMPAEVFEKDGWLAGLENGSIRRAKSAVPLRHDLSADAGALDRIEAAYVGRGLTPAFRLADVDGLLDVRQTLARRGYRSEQPTLVMLGSITALNGFAEPGEVIEAPDVAWSNVFLGEGFDPVDGAYRVAALSRSKGAVFGRVREAGETLAVGVAAFGQGWTSIHGMRTAKARRGEGLAGRVLAALAHAAAERGVERVFLQVEETNGPARALYRRAGFSPAWRYLYWSREDA